MLKLIQIEFLKLRRRSLIWIMMLGSLVMPFFAMLYYGYLGKTGVEPMAFYKWSALGYTSCIILPFVLGTLGTILMHNENQYDILKQLWIVPVSRMGYFFSKFFILLLYSICFMLITSVASVLFSVLPGYVDFDWNSILFLVKTCMVVGVFTAVAMLPVLAVAASQKGYLFPLCVTLIYAFLGLFLIPVNMYLHPLASVCALVTSSGKVPGLTLTQTSSIPLALVCIGIWSILATGLAGRALSRRK